MEELIEGYRRFRETDFVDHEARFRRLARRGQAPKAVVVSCCDSRVDPQMIFGAVPGDLFVVRNVANLVPPYQPTADYHGTSAAIEFGVRGLRVRHVIVMGHTQCGGIGALLAEPDEGAEPQATDFIGPWMQIAAAARERCRGHHGEEAQRLGELEGIRISLENLLTFPWIRERVEAGSLGLEGFHFDFSDGSLLRLDRGTDDFLIVPPESGPASQQGAATP